MRKTFISVRLSVSETDQLIAFANRHDGEWCSGTTPQLANAIGKITDARRRLTQREREYRQSPIEPMKAVR